jgi:hypothetical protein
MSKRCDYCGGRWDRPGLDHCDNPKHPAATLAQTIVAEIEADLDGRRGVGWSGVDEDIADEIRDKLAAIVEKHLGTAKEVTP